MLANGYAGRILRVDLTEGKAAVEPLEKTIARAYIGGRGLGSYLAYREMAPHSDPLAPENPLYLVTGPLQGSLSPFAPKFVIINKSPLSGSLSRSVCGGGGFGPELKYAGYDVVAVTGRAPKPVYLWIVDDRVQIRDARPYEGRTTSETQAGIRKELNDPTISVIPIGPAGENLVRFAGVVVGSRAAARGGTGAVMGSKNLKAIAVRGTRGVRAADPERFRQLLAETYAAVRNHPDVPARRALGTPGTSAVTIRSGVLPVMNFSRSTFPGIEELMPDKVRAALYIHDESCFGCPLPCGKMGLIKDGPYRGMVVPGPEYETIGLLGSNCGISDIRVIAQANHLCNEYGLDTISTGGVIAFAIECYERGLITERDTGGLELRFGEGELLMTLIEKIARREGFGELLAEGTRRVSEIIGQGSERFAMHSKGQDFAAYEPRALVGMGLLYATATPGANHSFGPTLSAERLELKDMLTRKDKGRLNRREQNRYCLQDSMIFCSFSRFGMDDGQRLRFTNAVTGWEYSEEEATIIADRIYALERLYNVREGFSRRDDDLPWRCLNEPMPDGPAQGNTVPLEGMLTDYYRERGWDEQTGVPLRETVARLGLADVAGLPD